MIELYCDGSCPRPNGPGGWAYIIVDPMTRKNLMESGAETPTTNNRMEMMAAIKGFEHLVRLKAAGERVRVTSDSQYVIRGLSQWAHSWKMRNWRRKDEDGKWVKVKNVDLWPRLFELAHETFVTEFEWVRGHRGHEFNEMCDKLAGQAAWGMIERS